MPEPFNPQVPRNYLDDILDQAYKDLDLEKLRQESIIQSDNPDKVLSQHNKIDKQLVNESPEVQQAVKQKVYRPGYFDTSRTAEDILPGKRENKHEQPFDELLSNYIQYNEKISEYTLQEKEKLAQEKLGSQRPTTSRMRMADYKGQTYTQEDIESEAIGLAKARLADEGLIKPKATGLTALKETFTDWDKFGKKLPWIGGGVEAQEAFGLIMAIRDAQNGTADEDDYRILIEAQMEMERDRDWTNMATEIFLTLPGYAIEFSSTGPIASTARQGTKASVLKTFNWILSKQGKKLIKEGGESFALRATQGALGTTVGAVARTINPKTWNRTLGNTAQQMIPDYELNRGLDSRIEVTAGQFKDWGTALTEGALLTFTENLGEEFGEVFAFGGKEFRAYMKTNPESAVSGLMKSIVRKNPNVKPGKVMQAVRQAGIHSVPVEILEERVTDFLQSGIDGHEFHWPTPEEWLAEVVAIGGFAGGARAIGSVSDSRTRKRQAKSRERTLSAIETGQVRNLSDKEIIDFVQTLTPDEATEVGFDQERGFEAQSDLGKEVYRRQLNVDYLPGTPIEEREKLAKDRIKKQRGEGKDFVGLLIAKAERESGIKIDREFLDRTLQDEADEEGWDDEKIKQVLRDHGLKEDEDPSSIILTGTSFGGAIRISTAGTEARMADEWVAVSEEMSEEWYKAESKLQDDYNEETGTSDSFEKEIETERKKYHEATSEQDKGESNLEWFSTKAVHFAIQGEVHKSIGARLKDIFKKFIESAQKMLADANRLKKAIDSGKVSKSLISKLESATDFKKVGESVAKAKNIKGKTSKPSQHLAKKDGGDLVLKDIPIEKKANLQELAVHLTDRAKAISEELGVDLTQDTPEAMEIISNVISEEIKNEIGNSKSALGWYSVKMQNAIELLAQVHPEIMDDPNHNQVFKVALAITSNGTPVEDNLKIAMVAYESWRDNGVLPSKFTMGGQEADAMVNGFRIYNKLVKKHGIDGAHEFINTEFTVKEIKDMGHAVSGELTSTKVMGAVIFGPKVGGGFLANLNGYYQYLTMDRWFMRTMGRIRGNLKVDMDYSKQLKRFRTALRLSSTKMKLYGVTKEDLNNDERVIEVSRKILKDYSKAKYIAKLKRKASFYPKTELNKASNNLIKTIEKLHENPANGTERKYLREAMESAVKKTGIKGMTMADGQAIIWFPEKRLFGNFGVGSQRGKKETDYETEARKYVRSRARSQQSIRERSDTGRDTSLESNSQGREENERVNGQVNGQGRQAGSTGRKSSLRINETSSGTNQRGSAGDVRLNGLKPLQAPVYYKAIQEAKKNHKFGSSVYVYDVKDYKTMKMFMADDKSMGYAVKDDGDLVSVFLNPTLYNGKDAVNILLPHAIKNGATKLDCFDTVLPYIYRENGFKEVRRENWDDKFAPLDWDKDLYKKFNNGEPDIVYMELDPEFEQKKPSQTKSFRMAPTFYSQAERVTQEQFPPTMKSQSIENFLLKHQVKPEEIEWLDITSLTRGKVKVTKGEILDYIRANKIEVQDVMKGDLDKRYPENIEWIETGDIENPTWEDSGGNFTIKKVVDKSYGSVQDGQYLVYDSRNNDYPESFRSLEDAKLTVEDDLKRESSELTKHSQYQLPGEKEDYRELLLTLPVKQEKVLQGYPEFKKLANSVGLVDEKEIKRRYEEYLANPKKNVLLLDNFEPYKIGDTFTTGHYEEPNILAHVRFNTRKSPTGEQVLFIEELQSDWHTEGRRKGYKGEITTLPKGYKIKSDSIDGRMYYNMFRPNGTEMGGIEVVAEKGQDLQEIHQLVKKLALEQLNNDGTPNAPFKGNGWIELIMKRMLRYGAENNFDRIAWTTSNQQIERWSDDLRQNVDQIHWQKNDRQAYADWVYAGRQGQFIANMVVINGLKKKKSVFNNSIPLEGETTINGREVTLEGLLGKQMATQIRNSDKPTGIIEGDNLTIGGEGFKTVYDFAIKKILNKIGKKFGAKVDQVELRAELIEGFESAGPAKVNQPSIPITRKMKESALKGQATFRASKMTPSDEVVDSPSFKKWFKDSKIVDKNGKPLVVYHGTTGNIEAFSKNKIRIVDSDAPFNGFWFSNETNTSPAWVNPTSILPVYLSIKNPAPFKVIYDEINKMPDYTLKEYEEMGVRSSDDLLRQRLQELGYDGVIFEKSPPFDKLKKSLVKKGVANWKSARGAEYVIKNIPYTDYNGIERVGIDYYLGSGPYKSGYESYITGYSDFENFIELHSEETYVAFEPTQIKSVFNKGTFNPHDPRISFHMAPTNLVAPLAKIYQEQKGVNKKYTKKHFKDDLIRLGYPDDTIQTAMDLFGIIRTKEIDIDDGEPTAIEKEIAKERDRDVKRGNIKSRLDALKRGFRLGSSEKKKEIDKLQKIVSNYARENLPIGEYKKSEVTGILAKLRDAKRSKDLAVAMEKIDRIVDKVTKRTALSKWNKSIKKKAKVKKVAGISRGTVGADVQDTVNEIKSVHKLSPAEVEHKIELLGEMINANEDGEPTEKQTITLNLLVTFGAVKHKSSTEINDATEVFDRLVADGRMQVIEAQTAYKERMLEVVGEILSTITGGAGNQTQAGIQKLGLDKTEFWKEVRQGLGDFDNEQQSLEYIFDKLSRLDRTSKPLQSFINLYFMPKIRQARLSEYNGLVAMQTIMKEKAEDIFGLKGYKLTRRLSKNTKETISVDHNDGVEGESITSELTWNQAYKKWMELMDPTLHPTFKKMGWDIQSTLHQIEQALPKDMIEWAKWQLYEFYPMYYKRVNQTFKTRFLINMPFNPMYSPISRRVGSKADEGDDTLNKSKGPVGSVITAGSLKGRVSNTEELAWVDGDTIMMKHITEMEHFINYTELMRELRTVFSNSAISNSIMDFHGKNISRVLNKFMDDIARGGVDRAHNLHWLDKMRGNFSRAVIGANPVVFMKQLASIPAYVADIPALDWTKEFTKLMNPLEFRRMYRTLSQSEMLGMRYDKGFERDMVTALSNIKPGKQITGSNLFNNAMYVLTKMGDKQAIFLGGWPVYKYHYKKALNEGKTPEEAKASAMKQFESASLRSQQSGEIEDLSDFARRGSFAKLFTMFMTSPNQYYRMVAGGYRNLYYGRGSKTENLRKIFVGQILLPSLFAFISNGFEWDEEEQTIAVFTFPFAGLLFFGQGFEWIIRNVYGKAYRFGGVPVLDFMQDYGKSLKEMFNGKDFDFQKTLKIMDSFLKGTSKLVGVPYGPAIRTSKGIVRVIKGEAENPIREAIGYRFDETEKEKKLKATKKKIKSTKKKRKPTRPTFLQ